jgi:tetratricopeptide (TPR) repeat protein
LPVPGRAGYTDAIFSAREIQSPVTYQTDIQEANASLQQGNYKRSLKAALGAAKKSPSAPLAPNIAGIPASALGKHVDAVKYFQRALKLKPDFMDAQKNLAQTLVLMGRADQALIVLERLSKSTPQDWKVWFLKAQAEAGLGLGRAALASVDAGLAQRGAPATVHHLRSTINMSLGAVRDAIADLENALRINPHDVTALVNLSLPLARQTRTAEALSVVQKAVAMAPDNVAARFRLGTQLVEMGRFDDGVAEYQIVLTHDPLHSPTLERLAQLLPTDEISALEPAIQAALKKAAKNTPDRACLFFALSAAQTAKGEAVEAEKSLALANREVAGFNPYDAQADAAFMRKIIARFPAPLVPENTEPPPYRPVFVIGLPRSGTTLVEAMLGAHPQIAPLGERGTIGFLLADTLTHDLPFGAADIPVLVREDTRLLPDLPEGASLYVDKMPENYRLVGFLKAAYPDCRIINLRRDPRDIAQSMWKSHFSGSLLSYAYDLRWMAAKFNLYASAMDHWRGLFGDAILDLRYEDLIADVEAASRRIAAFCNVDWHSGMARPDLSADQVLTLSATQLRQPVHGRSVGKWRQSEALLAPFISDLDRDLWRDYLE